MGVEKPSENLSNYIQNLQNCKVVLNASDIRTLLSQKGLFDYSDEEINNLIKQADIGGEDQQNSVIANANDGIIEGSELRAFCTFILNKLLGQDGIGRYNDYYREEHPFDTMPEKIDKKVQNTVDYLINMASKIFHDKDTIMPNSLAVNNSNSIKYNVPYKGH